MNTVGTRLLAKSKLGAKFRLYSGAGLSTFDMITDVSMIIEYLNTPGQEHYGHALIAMVSLCLLAQLFIVRGQTKKRPKLEFAKEAAIVLFAIKPGIDAYRVANGAAMKAGAMTTPETELGETGR
jgi:hypothetical protein